MRQLPKYFENFAFRSFNFWDRATRAEYWCVMPVLWALILLAFVWDVQEVWEFLLRREVPPTNPLYYESLVLFVLTIIPRLSLTVRRLHDSGKSGKWANLPMIALTSSFTLVIGLGSAMMTSSIASGSSTAATGLGIGITLAAMVAGSGATFWEGMFGLAAAFNALGWDAIWAMISEVMSKMQPVNVGEAASQIGQGLQEQPVLGTQVLLAMLAMVATPFIAAFLHLFFMLLPSDHDHNSYGESSVKPVTGPAKVKTSENPLAGYAHLFEKSPEEEARIKQAQKAELKELYRTRVLGQPSAEPGST